MVYAGKGIEFADVGIEPGTLFSYTYFLQVLQYVILALVNWVAMSKNYRADFYVDLFGY